MAVMAGDERSRLSLLEWKMPSEYKMLQHKRLPQQGAPHSRLIISHASKESPLAKAMGQCSALDLFLAPFLCQPCNFRTSIGCLPPHFPRFPRLLAPCGVACPTSTMCAGILSVLCSAMQLRSIASDFFVDWIVILPKKPFSLLRGSAAGM